MAEPLIVAAAEAEYLESLIWYAERSPAAAEGFEVEFARVLQSIANEPDRFAAIDERHRAAPMRRYPYQVVYRREREQIVVIAVAHAKRRPRYWENR
jgi:plasmid stabilization system protein ParE